MKYLAAYLLLTQGGNESPAAADIKKVIESVGIEADESRISELLSALEGKSLDELVAEGQEKFASVPVGGAASAGAAAGGAAAGGDAAAEEAAEEEKEESDDDMGFGLFD
ncbi:Large ribosomal subunit protein P2B [Nakaseomyces bracarensis]|uniref:Large ribosomal subunit protein P2B n=1 Tax=Nakaseomyces bracarensis TaxID=273131 RepID=A0ABR4NSX9_9SACH